MRIAWAKVTLPMELDFWLSTTNTGSTDRSGFMRAFVDRGHEITLYTSVKPHDEILFTDRKKALRQRPYMSWTKSIKYLPTKLPRGKEDVLIVEGGADTMNFGDKYTKQPCIRRFADIVNAFEGPVLYLHMDPTQPFQFKQFVAKKYPWGHKMNGYTNPIPGKTTKVKNWVMYSQWATREELFKNKTTVLVAKTEPDRIRLVSEIFNVGKGYAGRSGYGDLKDDINFEWIPAAHDPVWFTYKNFKTRGKGALLPQLVIYTGGDRGRRRSFRRLCDGTTCGVLVTGLWKEEKFNEQLGNVHFTGWMKNTKSILELINISLCGIQIVPTKTEQLGWTTAKTFETIYGRSFLFMDKNIYGGDKYVADPYFLVGNAKEVSKKAKELFQLSKQEREDIHESQIQVAKQFTWDKVIIRMEEIYNKYK